MCVCVSQAAQCDEPHYRRLLDGVEPRRSLLAEPAHAALRSAVGRLQATSAASRRQRERIETLLDHLSAHQELVRAHLEWCRTTDQQIKAVTGVAHWGTNHGHLGGDPWAHGWGTVGTWVGNRGLMGGEPTRGHRGWGSVGTGVEGGSDGADQQLAHGA